MNHRACARARPLPGPRACAGILPGHIDSRACAVSLHVALRGKCQIQKLGVCVGEWGCLACLVRKRLRADWYFSEEKSFVCWFGCLSAHTFQSLLFHSFSEENLKWQINIANTNIKAGEAFYFTLSLNWS